MGFLDVMKNVIFVDPSEQAKKNATKNGNEVVENSVVTPVPKAQFTAHANKEVVMSDRVSDSLETGEINQEIFNGLCQVIDESALPSSNYLDLKQNVDKLKSILTSAKEEEIIKAAYINLQMVSPDFSKEVISSSIDHYVKVIMEQKDTENSIISTEKKEKIDIPLSKVKEIQDEISKLGIQKDNILREISKKEGDVNRTLTSVENAKIILGKKEQDLITTINHIKTLLVEDKVKILKALSDMK